MDLAFEIISILDNMSNKAKEINKNVTIKYFTLNNTITFLIYAPKQINIPESIIFENVAIKNTIVICHMDSMGEYIKTVKIDYINSILDY